MPRPITISHRSVETTRPGRSVRPGPPSLADRILSFGEARPQLLAAHLGRRTGSSLVELVYAAGLAVTVSGMAAPQLLSGLDDHRTAGAARYISARLQRARMDAVMRSTEVAMQFTKTGSGYTYA